MAKTVRARIQRRVLLDVRIVLTEEDKALVAFIAKQAQTNVRTLAGQMRYMLAQHYHKAEENNNV